MKACVKLEWCGWLLLLSLGLVHTGVGADGVCMRAHWQRMMDAFHPRLGRPDFESIRDDIQRLYANSAVPLWFRGGQPTLAAYVLGSHLEQAGTKGLEGDDYEGRHWAEWLMPYPADDCRMLETDLALSISAMRYISDMRTGRVEPAMLRKMHLDVADKKYDLALFLSRLAVVGDSEAGLAHIEPPFRRYRLLLAALGQYRELALDPTLSLELEKPRRSLRPGEPYADVSRLAYKLVRWGDLHPEQTPTPLETHYPESLVPAVKRFQRRHGLEQDGIIGRETIRQLNVPMDARVQQIRLSLERWRWLPDDLGHRPLVINVPEYRLYAFESGEDGNYRLADTMDVIVGQSFPRHQTPVFHGSMSYIVFSPYWNVPYSILKRELYEKILAEPEYLTRNNYEIVDGYHPQARVLPADEQNIARLITGELKLRQTPGHHNALGAAKFMFPNDHAVYMHGTPAKRLFRKDKRDFSHGCVRLADPPRLAAHVLGQESGWDRPRVDALIESGERTLVGLSKSLDVYVLYATAVADPDGTVRFLRDVYGHDERMNQVLSEVRREPST